MFMKGGRCLRSQKLDDIKITEFKLYTKPTVVEQAKEMVEYKVFVLNVFGFENYFIKNQQGLMKVITAELAFCFKCVFGKKEKISYLRA